METQPSRRKCEVRSRLSSSAQSLFWVCAAHSCGAGGLCPGPSLATARTADNELVLRVHVNSDAAASGVGLPMAGFNLYALRHLWAQHLLAVACSYGTAAMLRGMGAARFVLAAWATRRGRWWRGRSPALCCRLRPTLSRTWSHSLRPSSSLVGLQLPVLWFPDRFLSGCGLQDARMKQLTNLAIPSMLLTWPASWGS